MRIKSSENRSKYALHISCSPADSSSYGSNTNSRHATRNIRLGPSPGPTYLYTNLSSGTASPYLVGKGRRRHFYLPQPSANYYLDLLDRSRPELRGGVFEASPGFVVVPVGHSPLQPVIEGVLRPVRLLSLIHI